MTHNVVVLVDHELSARDASQVAALFRGRHDLATYHLLISTHDTASSGAGLSLLGLKPGDTFGSSAVARQAGAELPEDEERTDLGRIIEHSAHRLRAETGRTVTVAITHGDLLSGARTLAQSTESRDAVVVASSDSYARYAIPAWQRRASVYLGVHDVHPVEHTP